MQLMNKDSLEMTEKDHRLIALSAEMLLETHQGVVIVHGTDRLADTGEACYKLLSNISGPIVLTGAMRPYELRSTDALQNLVEALLAVQILPSGVYVAMHNQILAFPGVEKDRQDLCFKKKDHVEILIK
jgi:L-asparaginase